MLSCVGEQSTLAFSSQAFRAHKCQDIYIADTQVKPTRLDKYQLLTCKTVSVQHIYLRPTFYTSFPLLVKFPPLYLMCCKVHTG